MKLIEYLENKFPDDIRKMNFTGIPEQCLKCTSLKNCDKGVDEFTVYFGGQNWENFYHDINEIDKENLNYFIICLFMVITIDVSIYTYYNKYYHQFREKTLFPKFGGYRSGFGISPFYINPKKILQVPEAFGLITHEHINRYIDEYVDIFIMKCTNFFVDNKIEIKTKEFIIKILNDKEFKMSNDENNSVFTLIYNKLNEKINKI